MSMTLIHRNAWGFPALLIVASSMLAISGCSESSSKRGGYDFVTPIGHTHNWSNMETREGFVRATVNGHELLIEEDRLTMDEVDYGAIKRGDRLTIDKDGSVIVNGQRRSRVP